MDLNTGLGLGVHFTMSQILASLLFGIIGYFVFRHGKRELNFPLIFIGIGLMIYPMFTSAWWQDWGVGILLCGLAYYLNESHNKTG